MSSTLPSLESGLWALALAVVGGLTGYLGARQARKGQEQSSMVAATAAWGGDLMEFATRLRDEVREELVECRKERAATEIELDAARAQIADLRGQVGMLRREHAHLTALLHENGILSQAAEEPNKPWPHHRPGTHKQGGSTQWTS